MTLFAAVEAEGNIFQGVSQKYFDGQKDLATLERL
jgi:uncharacterized protein (DUF1810 family)